MLRWDCEIGLGALAGAVEPVPDAFSTAWNRQMLGEEFEPGAISGDEGETGEWTIRLVPAE